MSKDPGLEKMHFVGYSDKEFSDEIGEVDVQINPHTFTRTLSVDVPEAQYLDGSFTSSKNASLKSEKYSFDIVYDGTGVVDGMTDSQAGINTEIERFLSIVYSRTTDGNKRYPTFVKMFYCGLEFRCMLTSMSITYSLFHRNGAPLRAKISCSFTSHTTPSYDEREKPMASGSGGSQTRYEDCNGDTIKMIEKAIAGGKDSLF